MKEQVLRKILSKINPTDEERKKAQKTVAEALKICQKAARNSTVVVCGSFAKDTYLAGIRDVDVFFIMAQGRAVETEGMTDVENAAKALGGKYEKKFSSHPYLSVSHKGYAFDLVPAYDFSSGEELRSAVDRTPLHAEYVNSHLGDKVQARLIKAFCRGVGVYGADARAQGFSGYLCELFAIKYGSFENLLRESANFTHPLDFKDPVDESRNVASAVSIESLERFKMAARSFLSKQSEIFFFPKKFPMAAPRFNQKRTLALVYTEEADSEDALYSKTRSSLEKIASSLGEMEFLVSGKDFAVNAETKEVLLIFTFAKMELSRVKVVEGPPLSVRRDYLDAFVLKHGKDKVFQEKGRLFAKQERRVFQAKQGLQAAGRTFLPSFAIIDSQKPFQTLYKSLPDSGRARMFSFVTGKNRWQV